MWLHTYDNNNTQNEHVGELSNRKLLQLYVGLIAWFIMYILILVLSWFFSGFLFHFALIRMQTSGLRDILR